MIHICDAINRSLEMIEKGQSAHIGIPSGFPSLDQFTRGWDKGELVIIGGRPCEGKTSLALNVARNAAADFGVPAVYFSPEQSAVELTNRLVMLESGVESGRIYGSGRIDAEEWAKMEASLKKLAKAPLYIDDTASMTEELLYDKIREAVTGREVKLAVLDHLQAICQMPSDAPRVLSRLKETARELGVVIVVLTNIARPIRRKYNGPIPLELDAYCPLAEDYADKIILLHRPFYFSLENMEKKVEPLQLRLVKNKSGRTGEIELLLDNEILRVMELDEYLTS